MHKPFGHAQLWISILGVQLLVSPWQPTKKRGGGLALRLKEKELGTTSFPSLPKSLPDLLRLPRLLHHLRHLISSEPRPEKRPRASSQMGASFWLEPRYSRFEGGCSVFNLETKREDAEHRFGGSKRKTRPNSPPVERLE